MKFHLKSLLEQTLIKKNKIKTDNSQCMTVEMISTVTFNIYYQLLHFLFL